MKLNFFIPGKEPITVTTRKKSGEVNDGGVKRLCGIVEWHNGNKRYECNVEGKRYPLTHDSLDTYGHPNIWSTFLDEHNCNIRIVRQGFDKCNKRRGFLPFKVGHTVYGKLVNLDGIEYFDVRVNGVTLSGDYGDTLSSAWNDLKAIRGGTKKSKTNGD